MYNTYINNSQAIAILFVRHFAILIKEKSRFIVDTFYLLSHTSTYTCLYKQLHILLPSKKMYVSGFSLHKLIYMNI